MEHTETLKLEDCYGFLKENLDKDDIDKLAKMIDCKPETVNTYINGNFPRQKSSLFNLVSPKIVYYGFEIIKTKTNDVIEKMNIILSNKSIPSI